MRIRVIMKTNNQSDDGFTQNCKKPPVFHIYFNENVDVQIGHISSLKTLKHVLIAGS